MHYLCFQRKISMSANECINAFSSHLFWDIRKEDIDLEQYPKYIIKRVLEYGMWNDWIIIRSYYGLPKIVEEAMLLQYQILLKKSSDVTLINSRFHNTGTSEKVAEYTYTS